MWGYVWETDSLIKSVTFHNNESSMNWQDYLHRYLCSFGNLFSLRQFPKSFSQWFSDCFFDFSAHVLWTPLIFRSIYVMFDVKARSVIRLYEFTLFNQIISPPEREHWRRNVFKITSQQTRENAFWRSSKKEKLNLREEKMSRKWSWPRLTITGLEWAAESSHVKLLAFLSNLPRQTWKCFCVFFRGARAWAELSRA